MSESATKSMDDIVALCRRRGFIWQSSEIYGGINGFWDYGPLGAQLKKNLKDAWWHDIVRCPPDGPDGQPLDIVPLESTIIMNPRVWEASGHVGGFNDPMVACKAEGCKKLLRADHVWVLAWQRKDTEEAVRGAVEAQDELVKELLNTWREGAGVAELGKMRELLHEYPAISKIIHAIFTPLLVKTVVAGSESEALSEVKLSNRERKAVGDAVIGWCLPLAEEPPAWFPPIPCPNCGNEGTLTPPRAFNLMFESHAGAIQDDANKVYLRPETAQGIFTQFWNVVDTSRVKMPFGIAQVGKAFRNEVTPRNFTFRSREFEQMEIEFFIHPSQANEWYAYWRDTRFQWWQDIGLAGENLILREHDKDELAHYAKDGAGTSDVEYKFPFTAPGYGELEGIAHRADFDLKAHATACGKGDKMMYRDPVTNERFFPHVIEPSAGADRGTLAVLCEAFTPTPERSGSDYVMKFHPRLAPIKAGIFPLVNKDGMPEVADKLYRELRGKFAVQTDAKQSIGKRYARMDEAGTPFCFTIDGDTLTNQTVTVRHRDTAEQETIGIDSVESFLTEKIGG